MKKDEIYQLSYMARIKATNLKKGMKVYCAPTDNKRKFYLYTIDRVDVSENDIYFHAIYKKDGEVISNVFFNLSRLEGEPMLVVFFSSVEEANQFGIGVDSLEEV